MTTDNEHSFFDAMKDKGIVRGAVVLSCAGHDKGRVYIVCDTKDSFLYLCDGDKKDLQRPKKKRRSHVKALGYLKEAQSFPDPLLKLPPDQQRAMLRKRIIVFLEEQKLEDTKI